jgi:uncharacterized protein YqjF (DUF2071 family)|tara:strand:- start:624 stop:890 length:267 start_codon:yes stop_codon:yes gene_type:complete
MSTQTIQKESQVKETAGALLASLDGSNVGRGKVIDGLLDLYNLTAESSVARSLIVTGLEEIPGKNLVPLDWWQGLLETVVESSSKDCS